MNDDDGLARIARLFDARGTLAYGEAITQLEHALQCAALAERDGAPAPLIAAAWLHDVGHLLHRDAAAAVADGTDDVHEAIGAKFLVRWFGPAVAEPVRLHVAAKRWLCAREPAYRARLSPLSERTLQLQGGPMDDGEARVFDESPWARDAIALRRWDDEGKVPGRTTPGFAHFASIAAGCLLPA